MCRPAPGVMCFRLWIFSLFLYFSCIAEVQIEGAGENTLENVSIQHFISKALHDIREHYVESTRGIMVKLNNNVIPIYKRIFNSFADSTQSILTAYKDAIRNKPGISSRLEDECQDVDDLYRRHTLVVHHHLLECVRAASEEYMLLAQSAAQGIRGECSKLTEQIILRLDDCQKGVEDVDVALCLTDRVEKVDNPLQVLSTFAQEEMVRATATATRVSNNAYHCFGKQTLKVGKVVSNLMENFYKCATEVMELLAEEPIEGLEPPLEEDEESWNSFIDNIFKEESEDKDDATPVKANIEEISSAEGDL